MSYVIKHKKFDSYLSDIDSRGSFWFTTAKKNAKRLNHLAQLANETGNNHSDAGPMLSAARVLVDLGLDGCFPEGDVTPILGKLSQVKI